MRQTIAQGHRVLMGGCCDTRQPELRTLADRQKQVLWIVLGINLSMFVVEGIAGVHARSTALLADSLDMLGDAFVYGISLFVIGKSTRWNAAVSLVKGSIMTLFGIGVIAQAVYRFLIPTIPEADLMGWTAAAALLANIACAALLLRHRNDDLNMRSTWLCSRNDVLSNLGVVLAAVAVSLTGSKYPDLIVGVVIAGFVLKSAFQISIESLRQLRCG